MLERRPMLGLLIGLTLCVSIWRITMLEPSMIEAENGYTNQAQYQQPAVVSVYQQRQQTVEPQNSAVIYTRVGTILRNNIHQNESNTLNISLASHHISLQPVVTSYSNYYYYDELPKKDLSSLIDLNDFRFTINQLPCRSYAGNVFSTYTNGMNGNSNNGDIDQSKTDRHNSNNNNNNINHERINVNGPLVLILVHSAPSNYKKRLHIRETWGSLNTPLIRLIFLLGAVNTTKLQRKIELENNMFSDIVQGNFVDAYRNMTYKHVMALKWFTYYCPEAKFLLKIDDDVFVNTPYLIDFLNRYAQRSNLLFCNPVYWSRVKRSYRSKWRVSTKEYSGRYYPTYCPGYSIIYSPDTAYRLYKEAQKASYFWIDDVHITGTLSQKSNITITSSSSYILTKNSCEKILDSKQYNYNDNQIQNNLNNNVMNIEHFLFLFSWPDIEEEQARNLWKIIEKLR